MTHIDEYFGIVLFLACLDHKSSCGCDKRYILHKAVQTDDIFTPEVYNEPSRALVKFNTKGPYQLDRHAYLNKNRKLASLFDWYLTKQKQQNNKG